MGKLAKELEFRISLLLRYDGVRNVGAIGASTRSGLLTFVNRANVVTPTWAPMNEELGFSYQLLNNGFSIGFPGTFFGVIILTPFVLKYGRRPVYIASSICLLATGIWGARIGTGIDYMLVSFLLCFFGALVEVITQMTISDLFFVHQRGSRNATYAWSASVGSNLGAVASGYITDALGWRWVWWICSIIFGVQFVVFMLAYEETKYTLPMPVVIEAETIDVHSENNGPHDRAREQIKGKLDLEGNHETSPDRDRTQTNDIDSTDVDRSIPLKGYWSRLSFLTSTPGSLSSFIRHSYQPFQLLLYFPPILYSAMCTGILLTISSMAAATYSALMVSDPWNFTPAAIGLLSLASLVGTTIGVLVTGPASDWIALYLARRNNGIFEPEMRLWVLVLSSPLMMIGCMIFGFAMNHGWNWVAVVMGIGLINAGSVPTISVIITYILDAYSEIVGDALVSIMIMRNALATGILFALPPWLRSNSGPISVFVTMGSLGMLLLVGNIVVIKWGKKLRALGAARYRYFAEKQYCPRPI